MKIIAKVLFWLFYHLIAKKREPDQVIGGRDNPYLLRWWLFGAVERGDGTRHPRRPLGRCLFLHCFVRSDDDRALHDHPWDYTSFILRGTYIEHKDEEGSGDPLDHDIAGASALKVTDNRKHYDDPVRVERTYKTGSLRFGEAATAHRIELLPCNDDSVYGELNHPWMPSEALLRAIHNAETPVWTLFSMGLWKREWGFHCPQGWKHWREFTAGENGDQVGAGCDDRLRCYQCDRLVPWLAPDSRCTTCTQCTAEEVF
jgi:hypothetical protein